MAAKKTMRLISVDNRGRLTLPSEIRKGAETFSVEILKDGTLKLIPQEVINITDASMLKSLKKSAQQMKNGELEDIPEEWLKS